MTQPLRRTCAVLLLALVATVLPAVPVQAAPRDQVLTGRVLDSAGRPVVGAVVRTSDGMDAVSAAVTLLGCFLTLGFSQTWCAPHDATARTGRDGRYRLVLGHGTPVAVAGFHDLTVRPSPAAKGPPLFAGAFTLGPRTASLPEVRIWTSVASFRRHDGRMEVTRQLPPRATSAFLRLRGDDPGPYATAWPLAFDRFGRADLDERVFEDGTRGVAGTATGSWSGRPARWTSTTAPSPHVGRPGTRGRSCSTYRAGDELAPLPGCPFSDGRLATALSLFRAVSLELSSGMCTDKQACSSPYTLVYDFGDLRRPDAVVWRNCHACSVELSAEGRVWVPWRDEHREGGDFAVVTGALQPARYVRVRGIFTLLWYLQEVSVWSSPVLPAVGPALQQGERLRPLLPREQGGQLRLPGQLVVDDLAPAADVEERRLHR